MNQPVPLQFRPIEVDHLSQTPGRIAICLPGNGALGPAARRLDRAMKGQLARFSASEAFGALKPGEAADLTCPAGLQADAVQVVKLDRRADVATARKAGSAVGAKLHKTATLVIAENIQRAADLSLGLVLRAYQFTAHKTAPTDAAGPVTLMVSNPESVAAEARSMAALGPRVDARALHAQLRQAAHAYVGTLERILSKE